MTLAWAGDRPARAKASRIVRGFAWLSLSLLLILLSCLAPTPKSYSAVSQPPKPISILSLVTADLATIPPHLHRYIRYLKLNYPSSLPVEKRWQAKSFHVNQLSTEPLIAPPVVVGGVILRLNILEYGPLWPVVYERLAVDDPYDHVKLKVKSGTTLEELKAKEKPTRDGNRYVQWNPTGNTWAAYNEQTKTWYAINDFDPATVLGTEKIVTAIAPWDLETPEAKAQMASLVAATQSSTPILRGDWFVNATGIQFRRNQHGYYDWLGIKDQKTFEELIGFDAKILKRFPKELREAQSESGVSDNPRAFDAFGTVGGWYWRTDDFDDPTGRGNPLRVADRKNITPTAHENFAPLPNGLMCWGLFEAKTGTRQDSAPDFVGFNNKTRTRNGKIHISQSCIECHMPNAGINDIDAWYRGIAAAGGPALQSPDPEIYKELKRLYGFDLAEAIGDSRLVYTRAIFRATELRHLAGHAGLKAELLAGLKPAELAQIYSDGWYDYEKAVTPEQAAFEWGVGVADMQARFRRYLAPPPVGTGALDPILARLMIGKSVQRVSFEEAYHLGHLALRGLVLADLQRIVIEVKP